MTTIGQPERATQHRVIALFRDELGCRYLGDWTDRDGNSNIEESLLSAWLTGNGTTPAQISAALSCAPRRTTTAARSTATIRPSTTCCATACP